MVRGSRDEDGAGCKSDPLLQDEGGCVIGHRQLR